CSSSSGVVRGGGEAALGRRGEAGRAARATGGRGWRGDASAGSDPARGAATSGRRDADPRAAGGGAAGGRVAVGGVRSRARSASRRACWAARSSAARRAASRRACCARSAGSTSELPTSVTCSCQHALATTRASAPHCSTEPGGGNARRRTRDYRRGIVRQDALPPSSAPHLPARPAGRSWRGLVLLLALALPVVAGGPAAGTVQARHLRPDGHVALAWQHGGTTEEYRAQLD